MNNRISRAAAVSMVLATLGASQIATAKPMYTDVSAIAPQATVGNTDADVYGDSFTRFMPVRINMLDAGPQPTHVRVVQELDSLLFDQAVKGPPSDELQLSTHYGVTGLSTPKSGGGDPRAAYALPGFDIGTTVTVAGGRGTTAAAAVPEPGTAMLLLVGSLGLLAIRRRRLLR